MAVWRIPLLLFVFFAPNICLNDGADGSDNNSAASSCNVTVADKSIRYFRSRLQIDEPNFIRFDLRFGSYHPNYTDETYNPFQWYWTFKTSRGLYPYLHWNIDYNLLSFDLLDVRTLRKDPYIEFDVTDGCNLTLGTRATTELIAEQLMVLVSQLSTDKNKVSRYQDSYFCYLTETPGINNTFGYQLGLYFLYPINMIYYDCCYTFYNYTMSLYNYRCMDEQITKWIQCTYGPYILGLLLFLYCPIFICKVTATSTEEISETNVQSEKSPLIKTNSIQNSPHNDNDNEEGWLYLDGAFPKTFIGTFSSVIPGQFPVALSRLKRFSLVLLGPTLVFIQIGVYKLLLPDTPKSFVDHRVPVGFLSLLGNSTKTFVPAFGGPVTLLVSYYFLGIIFLVCPNNIQVARENGVLKKSSKLSPLGLSAAKIKQISGIKIEPKSGCSEAADLFLCSLFMIFRIQFWKIVLDTQRRRFKSLVRCRLCSKKVAVVLIFSLYIILCLIEVLLCLVYYSVPLFSFIVVIIRGVVKTTATTIRNCKYGSDHTTCSRILKTRFLVIVLSSIVSFLFIFYLYSVGLIFIQSFLFISQILVYCYIAVVIFPATSFGYLFFVVVLLYYIFRLIRGFGAKYLELLNDVVEIVSNISEQDNYPLVINETLVISNIKLTNVKNIKLNEVSIPLARNVQQSLQRSDRKPNCYLRFENNTYGIRRDLFEFVVENHLPAHKEVLRVIFHLSLICSFLLLTISITIGFATGPSSEMSDVMHVVFVVTVGAIPRVLEVALLDSSQHIYREIKLRRLEETVNMFLQKIRERVNVGQTTDAPNEELHNSSNSSYEGFDRLSDIPNSNISIV